MNVFIQYRPGEAFAEVTGWELDDNPVEMANLPEYETGMPGIVYGSRRQGRHGPRIKWYPQRAGADQAFLTITLKVPPRMLNHGVAPHAASGGVGAAAWAEMNRTALQRLWSDGTAFTRSELYGVLDGLQKLS